MEARKTLVISDSRGLTLQKIINDIKQAEMIKVISFKGAGYCGAALKAKNIIESFRPNLIIMLVGICDITKRDPNTKKTTLRYKSTQCTVEHVLQQARTSLDMLRQMGVGRISYATITGIDLTTYNKNSKQQDRQHCEDKELQRQQVTMNQAVLQVNKKIVEINTELNTPTTWTAGYVHRYFRKKHHHYYRRLEDGCHPTSEAAKYWVTQVIKTAVQVE